MQSRRVRVAYLAVAAAWCAAALVVIAVTGVADCLTKRQCAG